MVTTDTLTLESAKQYVTTYYASCDGVAKADIEGCGLIEADSKWPSVKLNVVVTWADGSQGVDQWDVWIEEGYGLYGEC